MKTSDYFVVDREKSRCYHKNNPTRERGKEPNFMMKQFAAYFFGYFYFFGFWFKKVRVFFAANKGLPSFA